MSSHPTRARRKASPTVPQAILTEAQRVGLLPLDYMLSVMRDPSADPARRDRMAVCAAQYCHSRAVYSHQSKKRAAAAAARYAGPDDGWGDDLRWRQ